MPRVICTEKASCNYFCGLTRPMPALAAPLSLPGGMLVPWPSWHGRCCASSRRPPVELRRHRHHQRKLQHPGLLIQQLNLLARRGGGMRSCVSRQPQARQRQHQHAWQKLPWRRPKAELHQHQHHGHRQHNRHQQLLTRCMARWCSTISGRHLRRPKVEQCQHQS